MLDKYICYVYNRLEIELEDLKLNLLNSKIWKDADYNGRRKN